MIHVLYEAVAQYTMYVSVLKAMLDMGKRYNDLQDLNVSDAST